MSPTGAGLARSPAAAATMRHADAVALPAAGAPGSGPANDDDFAALSTALRASGGLARGDELARLLQERQRGDFVSLARLIASRQVFSFQWQHSFWVPMLQFETLDLSLRPAPRQLALQLAPALDGWALACWFARPHRGLAGRRPVDLLGSHLPELLVLAHADRIAGMAS